MTVTAFQTPSERRQAWLEAATVELRGRMTHVGYEAPDNIRVSIGWPKSGGKSGSRAIGQCWYASSSSDKHHEIFISPELKDAMRILGVLAHELIHATLPADVGHKAPFKRAMEALGLVGKATATEEGPEFIAWATPLIEGELGQYPAGSLMDLKGGKKQTTRLVKCKCEGCGYVVRTTRKWIDEAGAPICPSDEVQMEVAEAA